MFALPAIPTPGAGHSLLVGLSGGLDSTVLLCSLALSLPTRAPGLRALHVHHGLHVDAEAWTGHCRDLCERLGVELTVVRVDARDVDGHGPEAAARIARYAAFESVLGDGEVLALAHHQDDQAETFLLRALRASGVDGLAAMPAWRALGRGWLWRPLLDIPRADLLAYARAHGLTWIEDPANTDGTMARNFVRHRILPLLRERWPHADASFARSAHLCADAVQLLAEGDTTALAAARGGDARTLDVESLLDMDAPRRARVLRRWVAELGLPPLPSQGIAHIEADLLQASPDAQPCFEWAGATIRRWRARLHAGRVLPPWPPGWHVEWDGRQPLALPDGGTLRLRGVPAFEQPVQARGRQGGELLMLPGRLHSHTLKNNLQSRGVPPWQRERLPLLFTAQGELLAAGDVALSGTLAAWLHARDARLEHRRGDD